MVSLTNWKDITIQLESLLRLRTLPIGIKLYEGPKPLDEIRNLRTPIRRTLLCQLITLSRTGGWAIGVTLDGLLSGSPCASMIGFDERPEIIKEGTYRSVIWFETKTSGAVVGL